MKVFKEGAAEGAGEVSGEDLELINRLSRKKLSAQEVFTFSLVLCDNEVDRDFERFDTGTLRQLESLFVGRTGISDHQWSSARQVARIYRTQLQAQPERRTAAGEEYVFLKAWAYMLRTQENAALIAEIEGGIKKETSVGCSVGERICSICGASEGECGHVKGRRYGGALCHTVLRGAVDAYEWSFVAVPAQKGAGVVKSLTCEGGLDGFVETAAGRGFAGELLRLKAQAEAGRRYLGELRGEVLRLCLICGRELYAPLSTAAERMDVSELESLREALRRKAAEKLPLETQLPRCGEAARFDGKEYTI